MCAYVCIHIRKFKGHSGGDTEAPTNFPGKKTPCDIPLI